MAGGTWQVAREAGCLRRMRSKRPAGWLAPQDELCSHTDRFSRAWDLAVPLDVYLNVVVAGILTGLVYGLMALGLSVIFGVVRVVNFAHGEMMSIAMYLAVVLFSSFGLDPLLMLVPIAAVMFAFGYLLQAGLINPFITRPEHSQFLLVVALAIIIVNALLIVFGPDARTVQTSYAYDSFQLGPVLVDASKAYAGGAAIAFAAALFAFFRFSRVGTAIRACADNYTGALVIGLNVKRLYALTFALGAACVGAAGCMMTLIVDVTPIIGPTYTLLAFIIVITGGLGSMAGALLGGVLIGLTEALAGLMFTPSAKSMFAFAILVLVLLFRPQGLLGQRLSS
jgi:branched-chain amino acid transport system permease protein